ncbi:MAG: ABC transporter permease [Velocimicrobium sp.]
MKALSITKRIIIQMLNDKRSLALILLAPIFLMTLIYLLLGDSNYKPNLLQYNVGTPLLDEISKQGLTIDGADNIEDGRQKLSNKKADAFLYRSNNEMYLLFESRDSVLTGKVIKEIRNGMNEATGIKAELQTEYLFGSENDSMFDSMGYIMLAIMSFFIIFILAGISFLRERTNQTMERLLLTPVKRWEVILGYTLGFGFFALIESILLLIYVVRVLQMPLKGSVVDMAVIMILLSLAAVCIGAFFSIFSNNEFQVVQFIPIIVIPQIFFSGLITLDTIPLHLGYLSRVMPVYYASDALKSICIRGKSCVDVSADILALIIFIVLFFICNTLLLKKYRSI